MSKRLAKRLREKYNLNNAVVVAPDEGGYKRAEVFSNILNLPLAAIHKARMGEETRVKDVLGGIKGKDCIIIDDIIGTGKTLKNDADELRKREARKIYGVGTHIGLYREAKRVLKENDIPIIGTNTIPQNLTDDEKKLIDIVDISDIIASVVYQKSIGGSLRKYFESG